MKNKENLELHFWSDENYNIKKVSDFLGYISKKDYKEIKITYIDFNLKNQITEEIYENNRLLFKLKSPNIEKDIELTYIIENYFIEKIIIIDENGTEIFLYIRYSEGNIFYTYEFGVEYEDNKKLFYTIKNTYVDLIHIFNPQISNGGFEVIWQTLNDIKERNFFEGIFGYISSDFIDNGGKLGDNFYQLDSGILFYITETFKQNNISKILKNNL